MNKKLFQAIEEAENEWREFEDCADAIAKLSQNPNATQILIDGLHNALMSYEFFWNKIEKTSEFQEAYRDRDTARADFIREYSKI